jgi:hypothetical protein
VGVRRAWDVLGDGRGAARTGAGGTPLVCG